MELIAHSVKSSLRFFLKTRRFGDLYFQVYTSEMSMTFGTTTEKDIGEI